MTRSRRFTGRAAMAALAACVYFFVTAGPVFALPPGLVSAWSGNGNSLDATGSNNATFTGSYVTGYNGQQAFAFNGTTTQFTASANGFPTGSADRTISLWVNVNTLTYPYYNSTVIFGYGSHQANTHTDFLLQTYGNQWMFNNNGVGLWGPTLSVNTWYYVAIVQSSNTQLMYINGTLVTTGNLSVNTPASGTAAGYYTDPPYTTFYMNGELQDIHVYNQALTATQVSTDMQLGLLPEPPATPLITLAFLLAVMSDRRRKA